MRTKFKEFSKTLLRRYRIKDWIHLTGFFLLGYSLNNLKNLNIQVFILEILTVCLSLAYAFSFNEIFEHHRSPDEALRILLFSAIPLLLTIFILPFTPSAFQLPISIFLLLSTMYSFPRFGLKSIPFVSTLLNTVCFSLLFLSGSGFNLTLSSSIFLSLCCSFQLVSQLIHEMEDLEVDRKYGVKTTAVFLGIKRCRDICVIVLILCILQSLSLTFLSKSHYSFLFITLPSSLLSVYFLLKLPEVTPKRLRKDFRLFGIIVGFLFLLHNFLAV